MIKSFLDLLWFCIREYKDRVIEPVVFSIVFFISGTRIGDFEGK